MVLFNIRELLFTLSHLVSGNGQLIPSESGYGNAKLAQATSRFNYSETKNIQVDRRRLPKSGVRFARPSIIQTSQWAPLSAAWVTLNRNMKKYVQITINFYSLICLKKQYFCGSTFLQIKSKLSRVIVFVCCKQQLVSNGTLAALLVDLVVTYPLISRPVSLITTTPLITTDRIGRAANNGCFVSFQGAHQNGITFTSTEEPPKSSKPIPDIRLVDGPSILAGRVQLLHRGQWRSVCTNSRK